MAITAFDKCDKHLIKNQGSTSVHKLGVTNPCRLIKIDFGPEDLITSASKLSKLKKNKELYSPYIFGDKLKMISRITERKIVHKRDFKSSFPLASNIYKASSDEFKALKRNSNRKIKKSVLTLPNEPAPLPQTCTVSDVNETEYIDRNNVNRDVISKKQVTSHKKFRKSDQYEYYDRDIRHIDLDCSSSEIMKRYDVDGKKVSVKDQKPGNKEDMKGHDVWTVLRNINRFQFRPSPRISSEDSLTPKRKKGKKRVSCKDRRLISETRRTEEIAYIADFEVRSRSKTPSSSADRVTVIVNSDSNKKLNTAKKLSNLLYRSLTTKEKNNNRTNEYLQNKNNRFPTIKDKISNIKYHRDKAEHRNNLNNFEKSESSLRMPINNLNKFEKSEISLRMSIDSSNHRSLFKENFMEDTKDIPRNCFVNKNGAQVRGRDSPKLRFNDNAPNYAETVSPKYNSNAANDSSKCNRKPRLVTTMPSVATAPKLTAVEIKRRLAHMKFPLVILGRDQLSSTMEVVDCNPFQFDGLQKHVWPFMLDWNLDHKPKRSSCKRSDDKTVKKNDSNANKTRNGKLIKDMFMNKKKLDTKPVIPNTKDEPSALSKKMLKAIFKKSKHNFLETSNDQTVKNNIRIHTEPNVNGVCVTRADASTETNVSICRGRRRYSPIRDDTRFRKSHIKSNTQGPSSRSRWSSEFIDNVIRNIKRGSYYGLADDKALSQMEIAVQTPTDHPVKRKNRKSTLVQDILIDNNSTDEDEQITPIPGFDEVLPAVEVKTLNFNQISVKHCMTNVVLQFDVSAPENTEINKNSLNESIDTSISFEAIENGQTKVFKFKTTIVNSILPAEICSVLPSIMRNFIDSNAYLNTVAPVKAVEKKTLILPVMPETTIVKSVFDYKPEILSICMSPALRESGSGRFSVMKHDVKMTNASLVKTSIKCNSFNEILTNGFLRKPHVKPLFYCLCDPIACLLRGIDLLSQKNNETKPYLASTQSYCMALLPHYTATHGRIIPAYKRINFLDIFMNMMACCSVVLKNTTTITSINKELYFTYDIKDSIVNEMASDTETHKKTMTVTISKLKIDSLFNGFLKRTADDDDKPNELESSSKTCVDDSRYSKRNMRIQINSRTRRIGYVKLYKRCKSTSNISGEKSCTSLNKILNLDDFFQALGSGKLLSSVFDGCAERKLMTSIVEMKSWISDITPRQALLMLLLTNKKDTPNLTRFRPILLQGIAVNRITRASELDMEIEVIERENFSKLSQNNAIPYLPTAVVNHNNLFEEMCWIAKTTASDYQKPFDESSEKLLKSLLEKRKKLNPSYLRVMARYVGLGLLKPANNKK